MSSEDLKGQRRWKMPRLFGRASRPDASKPPFGPAKWSMGVLNDRHTIEVPGSVLLLAADRNEPLGLRNVPSRTSHSSLPSGYAVEYPGSGRPAVYPPWPDTSLDKKKTDDGTIILEPQPDDSVNDPLNWPSWRRDTALLSLGFYCMIGGGITPIIAAGFTDVANTFNVSAETVSLTTGLYMMGLGLGSVIASPTAILYGKRPVYLASAIVFIGTCLWAAWSPSFSSLLAARVFQGVAISPVECLPSATIAEIFFLHERAYRIGIYTLLLLGGKNLVPLVSAAIIGRFGWRWVFWIAAMVVGLAGVLLFLFVPETFWDRTPTRKPSNRPSLLRRLSSRRRMLHAEATPAVAAENPPSPGAAARPKDFHVGFAPAVGGPHQGEEGIVAPRALPAASRRVGWLESSGPEPEEQTEAGTRTSRSARSSHEHQGPHTSSGPMPPFLDTNFPIVQLPDEEDDVFGARSLATPNRYATSGAPPTPELHSLNSPYYHGAIGSDANVDYFSRGPNLDREKIPTSMLSSPPRFQAYTHNLRQQPARTFIQQLRPYHGRLNKDRWLKVMLRPFILFAYPAVLWSAAVYACSIGWLIVISETLALIYRDPTIYNFTALQTGLVYVSPFIGGILGTGVAGKISDIIVRAMSRRNGGLYEPEFRLVMALPVLITTCVGLMGFGWSVQERDHWIVPTIFFGVLSFGCALGSTTAITFCVDSYRQYAGEALVTLNFSKNILHGLIFSLFVAQWVADEGPKMVFIWLGIIQLVLQLFTIPLYIYGKKFRMWTVRKNLMEKF